MTAKKFIDWRKRMGYTQARAARALGKSRRAIQKWEYGSRIPFVVKLACERLEMKAK